MPTDGTEKACGVHALDTLIHDDCPYCTRIRLAAARHAEMATEAAMRAEVERLLQEQEHEIERLQGELAKCRRLLREVCRDPERVEVDGVRCWEIITTDEWMQAAQAAGGGE